MQIICYPSSSCAPLFKIIRLLQNRIVLHKLTIYILQSVSLSALHIRCLFRSRLTVIPQLFVSLIEQFYSVLSRIPNNWRALESSFYNQKFVITRPRRGASCTLYVKLFTGRERLKRSRSSSQQQWPDIPFSDQNHHQQMLLHPGPEQEQHEPPI